MIKIEYIENKIKISEEEKVFWIKEIQKAYLVYEELKCYLINCEEEEHHHVQAVLDLLLKAINELVQSKELSEICIRSWL